jgi:hypothetical protein
MASGYGLTGGMLSSQIASFASLGTSCDADMLSIEYALNVLC